MQRAHIGAGLQHRQRGRRVLAVRKGGFAHGLHAPAPEARRQIGPVRATRAMHFDHMRLDLLRNQGRGRCAGNRTAAVNDRQPIAQALGLVHEVRDQHDGRAVDPVHRQRLTTGPSLRSSGRAS